MTFLLEVPSAGPSVAVRRPAKAKQDSCWLQLGTQVCSPLHSALVVVACGNDNTSYSTSYSGRFALHPSPRIAAMRAGVQRSCLHTRVVLSTLQQMRTLRLFAPSGHSLGAPQTIVSSLRLSLALYWSTHDL